MKDLTVNEKKRLNKISFCDAIYYIQDAKNVSPTQAHGCPNYDEILQIILQNIIKAGFQNVEVVNQLSRANCVVELVRKVDCFSGFSLFDFYGARIYTNNDGKWVSTDNETIDLKRPSPVFINSNDALDEKNYSASIDVIRDTKKIFLQVS